MAHNQTEKSPVSEHREEIDRTTINDGVDHVAASAIGGNLADMPKGYYTNWRFIGSVAAVSFMAQGLYLGIFARAFMGPHQLTMKQVTCSQQTQSASSMPILVRTRTTFLFQLSKRSALVWV
jgi:hypothetical protein|tara:strand:- start:2404 stop:2769 length:366 start_codon:yes stop_codon:yes gene_type:complete